MFYMTYVTCILAHDSYNKSMNTNDKNLTEVLEQTAAQMEAFVAIILMCDPATSGHTPDEKE